MVTSRRLDVLAEDVRAADDELLTALQAEATHADPSYHGRAEGAYRKYKHAVFVWAKAQAEYSGGKRNPHYYDDESEESPEQAERMRRLKAISDAAVGKQNPSKGYVSIPLTAAMKSALEIYVTDPVFTDEDADDVDEEVAYSSRLIDGLVHGNRLVIPADASRETLQRIVNRLIEASNSADDDSLRGNAETRRMSTGHRTALENLQAKVSNLAGG